MSELLTAPGPAKPWPETATGLSCCVLYSSDKATRLTIYVRSDDTKQYAQYSCLRRRSRRSKQRVDQQAAEDKGSIGGLYAGSDRSHVHQEDWEIVAGVPDLQSQDKVTRTREV